MITLDAFSGCFRWLTPFEKRDWTWRLWEESQLNSLNASSLSFLLLLKESIWIDLFWSFIFDFPGSAGETWQPRRSWATSLSDENQSCDREEDHDHLNHLPQNPRFDTVDPFFTCHDIFLFSSSKASCVLVVPGQPEVMILEEQNNQLALQSFIDWVCKEFIWQDLESLGVSKRQGLCVGLHLFLHSRQHKHVAFLSGASSCGNCGRDIPSNNLVSHSVFCYRSLPESFGHFHVSLDVALWSLKFHWGSFLSVSKSQHISCQWHWS